MDTRSKSPLPFLLFYGWPSALGAGSAIPEGCRALVLGAGLERPDHPDHGAALATVSEAGERGIERFGYLDIVAVASDGDFATGFDLMCALGVDGILLDQGGREFGIGDGVRRAAIEAAHARGLAVLLNAGDPSNALAGAPLGPRDGYLLEGFGLANGRKTDATSHASKCAVARETRRRSGVRLFGVASFPPGGRASQPSAAAVDALWDLAAAEGLDYFLVTESTYGAGESSSPNVTDLRPTRARRVRAPQNAENE